MMLFGYLVLGIGISTLLISNLVLARMALRRRCKHCDRYVYRGFYGEFDGFPPFIGRNVFCGICGEPRPLDPHGICMPCLRKFHLPVVEK